MMMEKMTKKINELGCKARKRKGFSFMEILVSLVLIVALSVGAFFMFNEAQQTRKMAQMNNDMDAIVNGLLTYESLNIDSQLPAGADSEGLKLLVTGLPAANSIDGVAHANLVRSTKATDGAFVDPWGQAYKYSQSDRTLSCTPKDASGTAMTEVVRHF